MNDSNLVIKEDEKAIFELRALYQKYGYTQYKMSKFEEYDLYVRNKSFLVSEMVLTFTDTNGKLMALKPDVTLSIIKNTKDDKTALQKVYYNENVYRVSGASHEFKEIMQTGLECIGDIDLYAIGEVIMLAAKSLEVISRRYILDISHMGFTVGLLESLQFTDGQESALLQLIREKNIHGIQGLCDALQVPRPMCEKLKSLAALYGPIGDVLPKLRQISINEKTDEALRELETIYEMIKTYGFEENVNLDFSIVNDMKYYNGVIFQGFLDGIPSGVLSGGQYDNLLHKMGKNSGAIGFAVYLDLLERLHEAEKPYDVDVLVLYGDSTEVSSIIKKVELLTKEGKTVKAQKAMPDKLKYKELIQI